MTWAFGISEVTTWPWTFEEDVERYAQLGAAAIEVWEFKLANDAAARRAQLALPRTHDLAISSFQAAIRSFFPTRTAGEPAAPQARCDAMAATMDALAPHMPGAVFVLNTGVAPNGDVARAFDTTVALSAQLAQRAREHGVGLALEPLYPLAMNEDSFAWNLEDAMEIVAAVDHPAFGMCADAWNLARQHEVRARLARCRGKIFIAQIADFRRPRSFLDRLGIGDGSLDFVPFLEGLREAEYDGPLVLEIFSKDVDDSLYERDLLPLLERSRSKVDQLIRTLR